jgi:hypothetical protein
MVLLSLPLREPAYPLNLQVQDISRQECHEQKGTVGMVACTWLQVQHASLCGVVHRQSVSSRYYTSSALSHTSS